LLAPHPGRIRACPVSHGGTLGRDEDAALRLDAPGVAPHHARVDLVSRMPGAPPEIYVTDSGTTSGTYVSGMRAQRTVLHDGDLLRVGGAIALVVERDVGTFDGTVVDEGSVVRGPRSRRGWWSAVERAIAEPKEGRRAVTILGPKGSGRRTIARKIAQSWGFAVSNEGAMPGEVDVSTFEDGDVEGALAKASSHGMIVLRGLARVTAATQSLVARVLSEKAANAAVFAVFEEPPASLPNELGSILGLHRIEIPSIEQRREEIPAMMKSRFERRGVQANRLSIELYEAMTRAAWPGELAELMEVVDGIAAAHAHEPRLGPEHLVRPLSRRGGRLPPRESVPDVGTDADRIRAALLEAKGSVAAAARALHLSRQALYREAARLGIDIRRTRDGAGI
jgi:hypothetical protein